MSLICAANACRHGEIASKTRKLYDIDPLVTDRPAKATGPSSCLLACVCVCMTEKSSLCFCLCLLCVNVHVCLCVCVCLYMGVYVYCLHACIFPLLFLRPLFYSLAVEKISVYIIFYYIIYYILYIYIYIYIYMVRLTTHIQTDRSGSFQPVHRWPSECHQNDEDRSEKGWSARPSGEVSIVCIQIASHCGWVKESGRKCERVHLLMSVCIFLIPIHLFLCLHIL